MYRVTELRHIPNVDIFQKSLFCTLASSKNLVLTAVLSADSICDEVFLFLLQNNHFWSFHAFSKN